MRLRCALRSRTPNPCCVLHGSALTASPVEAGTGGSYAEGATQHPLEKPNRGSSAAGAGEHALHEAGDKSALRTPYTQGGAK